jgi:hypothetical protein
MGGQVSKLCKDFKLNLKSTCISNCCSDKSKNDVIIEEPKEKPHKHKKKHNHHIHKHHHTETEIVG